MATNSTVCVQEDSFLRLMARSGVPIEDARWFHLNGLQLSEGFKASAEGTRVKSILRQIESAVQVA